MSDVQAFAAKHPRFGLARLAAAASLVATIVLLLWAGVAAWQTARLPFLGLFTEPTLVVNGQGDRSWAGYAAGLSFPQRLTALDGRPLDGPRALVHELAAYRPGETVGVSALHTETGERLEISVRLTSLPFSAVGDFFLVPWLVATLYLLSGWWAFRARGGESVGQVFALLCALVALMLGLLFDLYTTHYLFVVWVVVVPLMGSAAVHLALILPQKARFLRRRPALILLAYLPGLALAAISLRATLNWDAPTSYFVPWNWGRVWAGLGAVMMTGTMVYHRYSSRSPIVRAQARTILWGALLAFAPVVVWIVLAFRSGFPFYPLVILPPFALFPLSIAYTLRRRRALDIDWVLRRAVAYVLLTTAVVGIYFLLLAFLGQAFGFSVSPLSPVVLVLFSLLVALGTHPVRMGIQRAVDRLLLGRRVTPEQALHDLAQKIAMARTGEEVTAALAHVLEQVLAPRYALLYLPDKRAGQYVPHELCGESPGLVRFRSDGALAQRMVTGSGPLYLAAEGDLPPQFGPERERLARLGPVLLVPLSQGWLVIGPTRPQRFRAADVWFLEALAPQVATALERVRLTSDLERRLKELEALRLIAQSVSYTVELDDLLELVYTQTNRVMEAENFYMALYDQDAHAFHFAFYVENGERLYPDDVWPDTEGLTSVIVRTGRPIVTDDYLAECERRGVRPGGKPGRAWMGMPLISRDRVLGVLNVSSFDPQTAYTKEQAEVFRAIADQAATILDKARLYGEMEKRAHQLEVLNEVSSVITSTLELDTVLDLIMQKAIELLQAEAGSLLLLDEDTGELVFWVTNGPRTADLVGKRLPLGTGIVGKVAESACPLIVDDVQRDGRWYPGLDEQSEFVTRSVICVPLIVRERVIGVVELLNRRDGNPFDTEDQRLLTAFAAQAAVSIENARLFTMTDQALADRVEELSMMQRVDRELNATLDYQQVMEITLSWALRTTGADMGVVAVVAETEEGQRGLHFLASQGYPEELVTSYREVLWPLDKGIIGRVVRTGEPELVLDVEDDPDYVPSAPDVVAQLTAPIRREERVVGAIALESTRKGRLGQEALDFVVRLADHAAIAIENARLFEAVQAANDAKTEFVSFVSHELKQPMTSMRGYTDLLMKGTAGELNEMQRSFLDVIRANVARMDTLVQDLLEVSRIEAGRLKLEVGRVSMEEVIEEAVRAVRREIEAKRQELEMHVPDLPLVVADRNRLLQILTNLLSNACKYTAEEGRIRVAAEPVDGRFVSCSVSDTGIGMTQEEQGHLFTKYFRSQNPLVRSTPGTGLGLVITKSLVELQGGEIWVESEPGKGSTFAFTVPVADA